MADTTAPEQPAGGSSVASGASFAVFLSHNSRDKEFVERIAERLKRAGLEPWLDAWSLVPGTYWMHGLAAGSPVGFQNLRSPCKSWFPVRRPEF